MPRFSSLPPREIFQDSHLDSMNLMIDDDGGDLRESESPWDTITPKSPPVSIHASGNDASDIYTPVSKEEYKGLFQTQCDDIIKRKEEEREYQRREYQRRIEEDRKYQRRIEEERTYQRRIEEERTYQRIRLEKQQELDSMREIRRINKEVRC